MPSKNRRFSQGEVESWSRDGVKEWLVSVKLESCIETFEENNVDGYTLLALTTDDIKGMVQGDKQRKTMKKALSALPGNSVSKKDSKDKKKRGNTSSSTSSVEPSPSMPPRRTRGPLPAEPVPSLPPNHPPSPGLPSTVPPPVPSGSSRPTFQRLGPPIPTTPRPSYQDEGEELYEGMTAEEYDEGPDDVYDSVDPDEIAGLAGSVPSPNFLPPSPMSAPPPPMAPPGAEAYDDNQPIYDIDDDDEVTYDDDQPIYDIDDDDEVTYDDDDDSFESSSDPGDDYDEPPIENNIPPSKLLQPSDSRSRLASNANIRSIMGKFYAHGVLKEHAELVATKGASHSNPGSGTTAPPPPGPPPDNQEEIIDEDIYDCVPDEIKEQMMMAGEDDLDEDIYDLPPEQEALHVFTAPPMRPPIGNSFTTAPPPPEAPPPDDEIIDEDIYDAPSDMMEETGFRAPPPLTNEIPPARPPKPQGSPVLPGRQQFNRPPMRAPIGANKPPAAPPPPAAPLVPPVPLLSTNEDTPPVRPPKPESDKSTLPHSVFGNGAPKTNGLFNKPKLRSPISPGSVGGAPPPRPSSDTKPPPRPPSNTKPPIGGAPPSLRPTPDSKPPMNKPVEKSLADNISDIRARLSPASYRHHQTSSPHQSPTINRKSESPSPDLPPTITPPPPPGPAMKHNLKPVPSKTPPTVKKPPPASNKSTLADRMKMFQSEPAQSEPSNVKKDAPVKEGGWKPPMRPVANESLPSDKKGQKNSNVSDLLSKFGGKARMTSPTSDRNSPSPEGVPILPPKPAGSDTTVNNRAPSPKLWRKDPPPKTAAPPLPSKLPPSEPADPPQSRVKQWPPTKETKKSSPLLKRKFEQPPKAEELLPPRSPGLNRRDPPTMRNAPPEIKEEKKPFAYKSYSRRDEPGPSLPPRISEPALPPRISDPELPPKEPERTPSLPPHPHGSSYLPPREPQVPEPTPSLPPRPSDSLPSLPPRHMAPVEPPMPHLPEKPRPGPLNAIPAPSIGAPRLPDRPPPSRNPTHQPPFSPPSEHTDPPLPPRPSTQQAFPPLPSRPPPKDPPPEITPIMPNRPPRVIPHGSPIGHSWYHGSLDRKKSEIKLRKYAKDGTFIIRDSSRIEGEYSLSIWHSGNIRHLRIRVRGDKKFVLGEEKADEVAFDTVIALVEYHKEIPLHLKSGGDTVLKFECPL